MINKIIFNLMKKSKYKFLFNKIKKVQKEPILKNSFKRYMLYTINTLLMNEMEIMFFNIYIEKVNWNNDMISVFDNLILLGLYVKVKFLISFNFLFLI